MRLEKLQNYLTKRGEKFTYAEDDECGSIDFNHGGVPYHIWEFNEDNLRGVETNVAHGGKSDDFYDDYEEQIIQIMDNWQY